MTVKEPAFPYFTWNCAEELESRLKKSLYHGGKSECMPAVSPVALSDLAVSVYVDAAPSPKRKLSPGYIGSLSRRLTINPCTMILGILYCERLRQINPDYLSKISSSDLFVVSLVVASKFLNDEGEDDELFNDEWAEAGGLGVSTVNRLEREFLDAIQWRAYVSPKEFLQFCNRLETRIALKHGLNRGWFSYTDLSNILTQIHFIDALKKLTQVLLGCTLMYSLSLSVMISTVVCINASDKVSSLAKASSSEMTNTLHPFAGRGLTRARKTVDDQAPVVIFRNESRCTCDSQIEVTDWHLTKPENHTSKEFCYACLFNSLDNSRHHGSIPPEGSGQTNDFHQTIRHSFPDLQHPNPQSRQAMGFARQSSWNTTSSSVHSQVQGSERKVNCLMRKQTFYLQNLFFGLTQILDWNQSIKRSQVNNTWHLNINGFLPTDAMFTSHEVSFIL